MSGIVEYCMLRLRESKSTLQTCSDRRLAAGNVRGDTRDRSSGLPRVACSRIHFSEGHQCGRYRSSLFR